ncbi:MAG: LamG domain-containing protein, partial [Bdellovibrionaceae bacterium]|nr:LamG domain-containing protein [Pseudobdellovibrionaceae bacterium]
GGTDIRFVAADNTTNLDYEIESWDVNGNSYVWVRIPTIAASTTTTIFLYFNNPSASLGSNPTSLWTRYTSVWHLEESATDAAPQFKDSTATAKHGTAVSGPTTATGIIGNALAFNGNYDSMDVGTLNSTLGGTATLSYWIKTNQVGNNTNYLAPGVTGVEEQGGVNDIFWGWFDASGFIAVTAGNGTGAKSVLAINDNVWRHITITRNSTDSSVNFYVNGVLNNSGTSGVGYISTAFSKFGVIPSTSGPGQEFDGTLDEIRITNTILSPEQVKAEFKFQNNQNNSNVSFGSIESNP